MKLFKKSFIAALIMSVLALSGCGDTEPRISAPEASGNFSVTVLKAESDGVHKSAKDKLYNRNQS